MPAPYLGNAASQAMLWASTFAARQASIQMLPQLIYRILRRCFPASAYLVSGLCFLDFPVR